MILALLLAASGPTALDAERAFAATAQAQGQWTAFRAYAADDATMFVPQPVNAQEWLKARKNPPHAIEWWPTASYVSCDGSLAVNTGGWKRPDGAVGYFSTVWQRQEGGGWKWIVDGGDDLAQPRPSTISQTTQRASCKGKIFRPSRPIVIGGQVDAGRSAERTLTWQWIALADGSHSFQATLWDGHRIKYVIDDKIAPPAR